MNTALLIIDVQDAICTGEWAAFEADAMIARINDVSAKARAAGAPVFLIQHEESDGPMRFDSEGWQLAAGLATAPGDIRLRKTAPDSFHRTDLQALLAERGITRLIACGLQSDFCVDSTVRGALALGYEVTLVKDGHSTLDNGVLSAAQISAHHNVTLASIGGFGPRVTLTAAVDVRV